MKNIMTPSEITSGEIGKIQELLGAALRKSGLQNEPTQQVLKSKVQSGQMIAELVGVVRKYVEAVSAFIIRLVTVNRERTPQEALDATGRKQYTDRKVVDVMPHGEGTEKEVIFFKPRLEAFTDGYITDEALEKEFEFVGLTPADPYSLLAVNEADPSFADEHPNATHWKDADGKWCFVSVFRWNAWRSVSVYRLGDWLGYWLFAGFRKIST